MFFDTGCPKNQGFSVMSVKGLFATYLVVLAESLDVGLRMLELAARHQLTGRRIHDARHAAAALVAGVTAVYTYDADDWGDFALDGLQIVGPPSTMVRLSQVSRKI